MNLNKIVKQLRGKNRYVVINLGGTVTGFSAKPIKHGNGWLSQQGSEVEYLATLAGTFTNWRDLMWDFSGEQVIADCKPQPTISLGKYVHHDIIQKWKENPDLRILGRKKGSDVWTLCPAPTWIETADYMIDPARKVQMGGSVHFYVGLTEIPEGTTHVWFSSIAASGKATQIRFSHDGESHQKMLKNGILHLTKENAVLMTEALHTITQVK